ncbi:HlyD family secretion protein [Shewanella violacea]|uniref:HlyD family secretion protein n=1 Tax=Shewanella violacea (strain JCM 10179 / CIP 106290 / LMG 19151 / DSS12) TaxID=637905 RepID=D4ZHI7_SHEVD|nr:HlyD family secretion protein [Shewanella violacea]BAJ01136.1 HlyD family secretion protein [Shewanella violacea DSS12]
MELAEKKFRRWMTVLIIMFVVTFLYLVMADRYAPMTTESRVQGFVVQLAPEVSGYITQVDVINNQLVKSGDQLFSIDDRKFKLAVTMAELNLKQAIEGESSLYAQAAAAKANITTSTAAADNALRDYQRISKLSTTGAVSESQLDSTRTLRDESSAKLVAAKAQLKAIETQLGGGEGDSSLVHSAETSLAQAKLDFSHTLIKAPSDGVVTNLQLHKGSFASTNQPLLTFIPTDSLWITADFREKATSMLKPGMEAEVTFDGIPGEILTLEVSSRDFGVASAQQVANGQLSSVVTSNRWVRDAQRVRVNFKPDTQLPDNLFVGSRATVVIYPTDNIVFNFFGGLLIRMVSLFHYVY